MEGAFLRFRSVPARGDTLLFLGLPGTGKTHLAVALGREAIRQNYNVQFITAATLVATLAKAHSDGSLDKQLRSCRGRNCSSSTNWAICPSRPMPPTCSSNSCHGATRRDRS